MRTVKGLNKWNGDQVASWRCAWERISFPRLFLRKGSKADQQYIRVTSTNGGANCAATSIGIPAEKVAPIKCTKGGKHMEVFVNIKYERLLARMQTFCTGNRTRKRQIKLKSGVHNHRRTQYPAEDQYDNTIRKLSALWQIRICRRAKGGGVIYL